MATVASPQPATAQDGRPDTLDTSPDSVLAVPDSVENGEPVWKEIMSDTLRFEDDTLKSRVLKPDLVSSPFPGSRPRLYYISLEDEKTTVERDSAGFYRSQRRIGELPSGIDRRMDFDEYAERSLEHKKRQNWGDLIQEFNRKRQEDSGLLDFRIDIPGGEQSAFTTIFGKPEVNLKVNGTANLNAGASIQKTANPRLPPDQQTRIDPVFSQSLKLNIEGNIGDKLSIQTDWDTERSFDFQNRLSIVYQGYEDEILQEIQMGNVSMETGNSLVQGGGSLFGIKSRAKMGPLSITSVISQQNGESSTKTLTGGASTEEFEINPAEYEYDKHYFLDFYPRQEFEGNMSNPQQLRTALNLVEIQVWILNASSESHSDQRPAIALLDLGTNERNDGSYGLPSMDADPFNDDTLDQYRDPSETEGVSASDLGVPSSDFQRGEFIPLEEGSDYEVNYPLGFITLKRNLNSKQALAVAFSYRNPVTGEVEEIGSLSEIGSGTNRIFLKLLRPKTISPSANAWDLMMKNIYNLGVSDIRQDGFNLDLQFFQIGENVPQNSLPNRNSFLLEDLGLDRVDEQGSRDPDNQVDFGTGTLDAAGGRVVFPYLQPFGNRIRTLLEDAGADQETIDQNSFVELYDETRSDAEDDSKNNRYRISGSSKGSVSDNYYLGFSLVKGSVNVFSGGVKLKEGSDYTVDYSTGNISILNEKYLKQGQEIKIEYESNDLVQIEQKTFTGVRAEYDVNNDITLGGTFFQLKERPLQDKIRIGDEPINNSIVGFDADASFDLPWLTRMVDNVPLLQTKAESRITFSGEFAQLRPDVAQTNAVSDAMDSGDLFPDEENGVSFVDDFEGVKTSIPFKQPSQWHLAAAPALVPGYDGAMPTDSAISNPDNSISAKIGRSDLRGQFSWYTIPLNVEDIVDVPTTPESERVRVTDVFPGRETQRQDRFLNTLDIHFDPTQRGPYNYNMELKQQLEQSPEEMWGGMTAVLPSGLEDLTKNNVEFLEFWVQPLLPGGRRPTAEDLQDYDGKIYVDIGVVSEDVVPNRINNNEDGLVQRPESIRRDQPGRSYVPGVSPNNDGQFSTETQHLEDVGLDGAPNTNAGADEIEELDGINEQVLFSDFINYIRNAYGEDSRMYQRVQSDPSNDDYFYFGQGELDTLKLHERFHRMYGYHDGNTPRNQDSEKRAVTNRPDAEGLITPSIVETNNSYYEYEMSFNAAEINDKDIDQLKYVVDKIGEGKSQSDRWYQVRIPLQDFVRRIGNIDNFQNISHIRIWMSGYEKPLTLRFATMELVGSQWKEANNVNEQQNSSADFRVSQINVEENGSRTPIPYRQPNGAIRAVERGQQQQTLANEQSIVLKTENLGPQEMQMVKKMYPGGMNLLNYGHLRMFVHGEGYENREDLELVMRIGTDLVNNYYEYRQPVTPSDSTYPFTRGIPNQDNVYETEANEVWLTEQNGMNIVLSRFNELKQLRDRQGVDPTERFPTNKNQVQGLLSEAPEGATIAIKGNPSLDRVTEIGMGMRNPYDPSASNPDGNMSTNGEFWLNELRVSGFDNRNGWATSASSELQLADFATINAVLNRETDGFGGLNSTLGDRRMSDLTSYDLSTSINLHKFIPERYGWNIPVSLEMRRSITTPRFLPNQGDIRLSEFKRAVRQDTSTAEEEKEQIIDRMVHQSQDYSEKYSFSLNNVSKQYSEVALAEYTLDKTTFSYVYNQGNQHDPEYLFQNNWNYNTSINYRLNFPNVNFVEPFGFLGDVPVLSAIAGMRISYKPQSINASANLSRSYNEGKRRQLERENPLPIQQTHKFNYGTNFGLNYNFMPSISSSFQSQTTFDISNEGIEPVLNPVNEEDSARYRVEPSFDVFRDLMSDSLSPRRSRYQENYSASWSPKLRQINYLSWLSYNASYNGGFTWDNSARGSNLGATVSNDFNLSQNTTLNLDDLLGRMDWYDNLKGSSNNRQSSQRDTAGNPLAEGAKTVGKKLAQTALSMETINISYSNNQTAQQSGYGGGARIFDAFNRGSGSSYSPPLSFRTGLTDEIGQERLVEIEGSEVQLPSNKNLSNQISVNTGLSPFQNLSIDLNWNAQWDKSISKQDVDALEKQRGKLSSSVWAFGSGYEKLFKSQLRRAFDDIGSDNIISDSTGNQDGRSVLGRISLQEDFRKSYLGSSGVVGELGFMAFPKPNWRVSWSGWENNIPWLKDYLQKASLNHRYTGNYRLGWGLNPNPESQSSTGLGAYQLITDRPEFEPRSVNLEKKFSPLIGINFSWTSGLRTNIEYEYSKISSLGLSSVNVTEQISRGFKFSVNYRIDNFDLPFIERLENAVNLTLNSSFIEDTEIRYSLGTDLQEALQQGSDQIVKDPDQYDYNPQPPTGQSRFKASAIVGYTFSQTIKADFEYSFNKLMPKSSGVFPRTDHDLKFNVTVSIRSN